MKIILSRKGFDLASGGAASPIIGGTLVPLPIPNPDDPHSYDDIVMNGYNVGQIVDDLTGGRIKRTHRCHLDPDLYDGATRRPNCWRPAFGQTHAALSHLTSQDVGPGDLFLFFGWYREARKISGRWSFIRGKPDLHVIYGWMQVGKVIDLEGRNTTEDLKPFAGHPHLSPRYRGPNKLYVAAELVTGAELTGPGGGIFEKVSSAQILTDTSQRNRSVWKLPHWFHPKAGTSLSYHGKGERWARRQNGCTLRSVGRGQEFVLTTPKTRECRAWIKSIFAN